MSQYIRPAIAVPAVAAAVAQTQGDENKDQRDLHKMFAVLFGPMPGTTQYGRVRQLNTSERDLEVPDAIYALAVSLGLDVSGFRYNSSTARGSYANTSDVPYLGNAGLRRQAIICVGDSRTNSAIGAVSPNAQDQMWSQGILENGLPTFFSSVVSTEKFAYNYRWAHEKSRLVWNFGRDSGRLANIPAWTYTIGFNWIDNFKQMIKMVVGPRQQLVFSIGDTNDIPYGSTNGNPGMAAVPLGTSGATYTGNINYIESVLIPFINLMKAQYGDIFDLKFVHRGMLARGAGAATTYPELCAKNCEVLDFLKTHKAAVGIDVGIDTRLIPALSPADPNVVLNGTYFFPTDCVHLFTPANLLTAGPNAAAYDKCLGFTPNPTYAGLIY